MPEVIFAGPAGRLEGRFQPGKNRNAPIGIVLHPHPQFGGTMNNQIVYNLFYMFQKRGFAVLRFNFRGVGRSQGTYDQGLGELSDAATALDWAQAHNPNASYCWVAGHSFGAWIAMQLLMRRPEIAGFISVSPPTNMYDFSFLAPCPASGLIAHGESDAIVPHDEMERAMSKVRTQKGIIITHDIIKGAGHLFTDHLDPLEASVKTYLDKRLPEVDVERAEMANTGKR